MLHLFRKKPLGGRSSTLIAFWFLQISIWASLPWVASAQMKGQTADVAVAESFEVLDTQYQEFLDQLLSQYLKKHPQPALENIATLAAQVQGKPQVEGLAAIRASLDYVQRNTAEKEFAALLRFLYQANDTATVQRLTNRLKNAGGPGARARNNFLLAQYYEERGNWRAVQGALERINPRDLSLGDRHYYHLLMGYALQNLKDHRKSIQHYQQIPSGSPYYAHAKLNGGTANLRQGWWTEAHMEFERAIQVLSDGVRDEALRNRLLVVLGYSQLRYEFYRDARNSLRKVTVNSDSANKALMGIGLAAAYQKDFGGAANAFRLLTEKPVTDLTVDEAFLLLPYALLEAGNRAEAGSAYQKAVDYYQRRLEALQALQLRVLNADDSALMREIQQVEKNALEVLGGASAIPGYIARNEANLESLQKLAGELGLQKSAQNLQQRYRKQMRASTAQNIEARRAILNSYLSQAKFGMAKLYDTP
jgi:hypothetical protein